MGKIAVVTDSTADLPPHILEEYDIKLVPLRVHLDGEEYLDWVEIKPDDFLDKVEEIEGMPSTSQPAVGKFVEVYRELAEDYEGIISIHFSQKMSGTFETAQLASQMVDKVSIRVIDSHLVTGPLGVMMIEIGRAAKQESTLEELEELVKELRNRIDIYFTIENFDYLEAGGRIGRASAFLGNLFNVRPVLTLEDGEITPVKKVRGNKRIYREISSLVGDELGHLLPDESGELG